QDFLVSDSELINLRGGSSRRENERPTPINLSKSLISQQIGYSVECTRKSNFRKAQIDFLPSPLGEGRKKAAFTLAEVLITLGITGVVAALTLPTLISNYQKQVWVNQLKKSVSVLSQGFTTMMGHDGVTELKDTEAFGNMGEEFCDTYSIQRESYCESFREALQNTFSGITFSKENIKYKDLDGTEHNQNNKLVIHFPDGSYLFNLDFHGGGWDYTKGTMKGSLGQFSIDVNGSKNPNIRGRDIFILQVGNVGGVYPNGSMAVSESRQGNPNQYYWRTTTYDPYKCQSNTGSGGGCAARVLEEGKMDY
ncbi:type II secretion system protein, partial [bacterium]|nr:type II secretion system protein [bacterium]